MVLQVFFRVSLRPDTTQNTLLASCKSIRSHHHDPPPQTLVVVVVAMDDDSCDWTNLMQGPRRRSLWQRNSSQRRKSPLHNSFSALMRTQPVGQKGEMTVSCGRRDARQVLPRRFSIPLNGTVTGANVSVAC